MKLGFSVRVGVFLAIGSLVGCSEGTGGSVREHPAPASSGAPSQSTSAASAVDTDGGLNATELEDDTRLVDDEDVVAPAAPSVVREADGTVAFFSTPESADRFAAGDPITDDEYHPHNMLRLSPGAIETLQLDQGERVEIPLTQPTAGIIHTAVVAVSARAPEQGVEVYDASPGDEGVSGMLLLRRDPVDDRFRMTVRWKQRITFPSGSTGGFTHVWGGEGSPIDVR